MSAKYTSVVNSIKYDQECNLANLRAKRFKNKSDENLNAMRIHVNQYYYDHNLGDIDFDNTELISKKELLYMIKSGKKITADVVNSMFSIKL